MPVIAIAAAVGSIALGGGAAIGAVLAGTATLAGTLTAIATVGATLGAIGAVTGDKTLGTIGMVMGAVGGIGSLAANAGIIGGEAASAASMGGDVASSLTASEAAQTSNLLESGIPGLGSTTLPDALSALNPTTQSAASGAMPAGAHSIISPETVEATNFGTPAQDAIASNMSPGGSVASTGTVPAATVQPTVAPPSASLINTPPGTDVAAPAAPVSASPTAPTAPAAADTGVLSSLGKFAKDNPLVAYGMLQSAGSFLAGATNPLTPAQVAAYKSQAEQNQASADLTKTQLANMKQPIPVASRMAPSGMINTPALANVTGAVA